MCLSVLHVITILVIIVQGFKHSPNMSITIGCLSRRTVSGSQGSIMNN